MSPQSIFRIAIRKDVTGNFRPSPTPSSGYHGTRWLCFAIVCCALLGLRTPFNALAQDDEPRPIFKPHGRPCSAGGGVQVVVHASPDLGGATPTVLVASASTVRLSGIARKFFIRENCSTTFTPVSRFEWKLFAQENSRGFIDDTNILKHAETLFPTFEPVGGTRYVAVLIAEKQNGFVRIEALKGRSWYSIGPNGSVGADGVGNQNVGRINDLVFDPTNASAIYAATAQGGVFKSLDRGDVWFPTSDHKGLPNLGISALAVAPLGSGQTLIFAAIGDNLAAQAVNVGVGTGSGVWRSKNGGVSWESSRPPTTTTCPAGTAIFTGNANRITASPNATDIYVAAQQGLFRSNDGGNCWTNLVPGNVTDVVLDPSNAQILYAALPQVGIFKSTAASSIVPTPVFRFQTANGLVRLAIAPSSTPVVYAAVADSTNKNTFLLRSVDGGSKWSQVANSICGNQCTFGIALAVDPTDPNHVIFGEVLVHHSLDGGTTFTTVGSTSSVHADLHALVFARDNPREIYAGTDGGVFRNSFSRNQSHTPNAVWESRNLELSIAQAATMDSTPTNSQGAAIGVWDNGSQTRLSGRTWKVIQGGDGFAVAADAASDQVIYYNDNALNGSATSRYPDRTSLGVVAGFASNPFRAGELFGIGVAVKNDGKLYVVRGSNQATTPDWRCADPAPAGVPAFTVVFSPDGFYYSSSWNGSIYRFKLSDPLPKVPQCGSSATAATGRAIFNQTAGPNVLPPRIALDPFDSKGLYALVPGSPGASRIIKLTPIPGAVVGGTGWKTTPIANKLNLPAGVRLQSIGADPSLRGLVYLGTTNGLWEGLPDSNGDYTWSKDLTVPDTFISGIVPHRNNGIYTGGLRLVSFGRGVWERQLTLARLRRSCDSLICVVPWVSALTCLNCARAPYQPSTTESNSEAWMAVPYLSKVNPGSRAVVRAIPLLKDVPQPFFLIEGQRAIKGVNLALVQLRYAAARAPIGLYTDSLRLEILRTPNGPVLSSRTVPFKRWWARLDARLLTVTTSISDPGPTSSPVRVSIRVGVRVIEGISPLTVAVPAGSVVYVQVPRHFESMYRIGYFKRFTNGDRDAGDKSELEITLSDNILLTAHYAFR